MTGIVTGLESEGLAQRQPDPDDARATLVEATAKGRKLLARARNRRLVALVHLLRPLDRRELDILDHAARLVEQRLAADERERP